MGNSNGIYDELERADEALNRADEALDRYRFLALLDAAERRARIRGEELPPRSIARAAAHDEHTALAPRSPDHQVSYALAIAITDAFWAAHPEAVGVPWDLEEATSAVFRDCFPCVEHTRQLVRERLDLAFRTWAEGDLDILRPCASV